MSQLFGRDFQERADRLRWQITNHELLDARRFGHEPRDRDEEVPIAVRAEEPGSVSESESAVAGGLLLLGSVAFVSLVYGLAGAATAVAAAAPTAVLLMAVTRQSSEEWALRFGRAYTTSFIGIFAYLTLTAIVSAGVDFFHKPDANAGWLKSAALHAPGLLVCALVIRRMIETPYDDGIRGLCIACVVSFAAVPTSLAATDWMVARALGGL